MIDPLDDVEMAVVIPAWNAAGMLSVSLPVVLREAGTFDVLVVDAGSTDETAEVARSHGAEVLRLPRRAGPAEARNAGVDAKDEEVILFLDADCVPAEGLVQRVREKFAEDHTLVSLTGSYDERPLHRNFFSLYMNLRHHFVHHEAEREGATFWAGLGAVRRAAFELAGGFDEKKFPRPMIEDIDLAQRLKPLGRMELDPDLQVKHLKRWSFLSVVRTDIVCRALPWSRLIVEGGAMPDDLNLRRSQRVAAVVACLLVAGVVLSPVWVLLAPWVGGVWGALAVISLVLHAPMLRCFRRLEGWGFALKAWAFHQVHLAYSALAFAWVVAVHRARSLVPRRGESTS
ncbi:MAG TPA: glycosyltransferase [Planctomycetes bacterium]|nr:glycosyltransferase [Planctomycetota bacterium]